MPRATTTDAVARPPRRRRAIAALTTLALFAGACADGSRAVDAAEPSAIATEVRAGGTPLQGARIAVGSKNYDEQLVLGHISRLVLEAAGARVIDRLDLGGTGSAREALTSGAIDHYWEYTGIGWFVHLGKTEKLSDPRRQWELVRDAELANGVVWFEPAPFNNTYGIAFKRQAADELGNPKTLGDFTRLVEGDARKATLCVESEFRARRDGLPGMAAAYGFVLPDDNVTTLDLGVVYTATSVGDPCNFGEVFTTDGRIAALDLQVLEDDAGFFPSYHAAPVFAAETYRRYGRALDDVFRPITRALTQDRMTKLNMRVSFHGEPPRDVARAFLDDHDLLPD